MIEQKTWEPGFIAAPNYVINGLPNTRIFDYESKYMRACFMAIYTDGILEHLKDLTQNEDGLPGQVLVHGDDFDFVGRKYGGNVMWAWQDRYYDRKLSSVVYNFSELEWFDKRSPISLIAIDVTRPLTGCPEVLEDDNSFFNQEAMNAVSVREWGEIKCYKNGIIVYEVDRRAAQISEGGLLYEAKTKGVTVDFEIA